MALDTMLASHGGVRAVVNSSCCSYIDEEGRVARDLKLMKSQIMGLDQVSNTDTSWGVSDIGSNTWNELTSWISVPWGWLKSLILTAIIIVGLFILIFLVVQCLQCMYQLCP